MAHCFVIGPGKSGTTLMISLLDNHPELSVIPLEIKFYDHYYNSLYRAPSYDLMNNYFLSSSKLRFLNPKHGCKVDYMNTGHIDFSGVDFEILKNIMNDKAKQYKPSGSKYSILPRYLTDLHHAYAQSLGHQSKKGFAVKEGYHGLPYLDLIKRDFKDAKFIMTARDPRDMYCSYKSIEKLISKGADYASFQRDISLFRYLLHFRNPKKNIYARTRYLHEIEGKNLLVVRYEDLVSDAESEMKKVASFLGIEFCDTLLTPTTAGNVWGGNASNKQKFEKVNNSRTKKWEKELNSKEILLIEYFQGEYIKKFGYEKKLGKISKTRCILSMRPSHFGRLMISWKDFFRPYVRLLRYARAMVFRICSVLKKIVTGKGC